MNYNELYGQIRLKKSFLCVGLDTDFERLPACIKKDILPQFTFNKSIIDATAKSAISFKLNTAFYECRGHNGWRELEMTVEYIKQTYPEIFIIADAKRGDIGNTSTKYASAFFNQMPCDAITVNPYMGADSVMPFLEFNDKWVIILGLTSNSGAEDFQLDTLKNNDQKLFQQVIKRSAGWGSHERIMFVAGATRPEMLMNIRQIIPLHFLLIPGIGAQGGDLEQVAEYGLNNYCGLLVNSSRDILFTDSSAGFADAAGQKAEIIAAQMKTLLSAKSL